MHIHTVLFWLSPNLTSDQEAAFTKGLKSLLTIGTLAQAHIGKPLTADRAVVDSSYNYSLHTQFKTTEDHDAYQIHPIHKQFIDECAEYWQKVVVYDCESISGEG